MCISNINMYDSGNTHIVQDDTWKRNLNQLLNGY